jgi:hypothetical protein
MKMRSSLCLLLAVTALSFCLPLSAQTSTSVSRIAGPIDESNLVTLRGNVAPFVTPLLDRGPAPVSTPTGRVLLLLQRGATQQEALKEYLSDVQNPSSPAFHKWLTPAQYGARFGVSDTDVSAVESWLQGHGFKIEGVPAARNVIEFSGSFAQIESAFHTSMHLFSVNGRNVFANVQDPQIPAALAPVVAGIGPLNSFHPLPPLKMGPQGQYDATTHSIQPALTLSSRGTPYLYIDPADAATIYDTPNSVLNANYSSGASYDGSGVNIGIAGVSDLTVNDVQNYRTGFLGETTSSVNLPTVVVDGNDPGLVSGWGLEALLDNEVAGGLAPKAKIYFYTSADTDLASGMFNAIFRALGDNVISILSLSVEACEGGLGSTGNAIIQEGSEQAAAQGITVVVAAGDNGSAACDNFDTATSATGGFAVNGYASSPYVVAVGGTDFDGLPAAFATYVNTTTGTAPYYRTALKYIPENPWNDSTSVNTTYSANVANTASGSTNIVAGSGGQSTVYSKPPFQGAFTPNDNTRDLPDVALFAGAGGYQASWVLCSDPTTDGSTQTYTECQNTNGIFTNGTYFEGVGGTSAAAPAFAGMMALVAEAHGSPSDNYRLGQVDNTLYQLVIHDYSTVFHDITIGNNAVYCATGSPNCGSNNFMMGYNAGNAYDMASGLGSVDAGALVNNWTSVSLGSTSTTLQLNGSTASYSGVHGANVTFNVGVTPATAAGFAAIVDSANYNSGVPVLGPLNNGQIPVAISSGAGTVTYNGLPGGQYTVYARYGGDTADAASSSTAINVNISPEASTTTLTVNGYDPQTSAPLSGTSFPYGSVIVNDAQITGTAEGATTQGVATGTVTFLNGSTVVGQAAVSSSDEASYPPLSSAYTAFAPGSYSMTAKYLGDPSFDASTSNVAPFTVTKATTSVTAGANPAAVTAGGSTTITVTVSTPLNAGVAPTGTVALKLGSGTLTTISNLAVSYQKTGSTVYDVLTGTGTVQASQLAAGSNTIEADYSGDTNYGSNSATVTVTAPTSTPAISMTNSGNIAVNAGATSGNTSTITVTPAGGFTGAVNLSCVVTTSLSNPTSPATCSVPASVTISGTTAATAALTVGTTSTTTSGTYTVVVTGTDAATGTVTSNTTVTVTVSASANPAIALTNSGNITVAPGATSGNTSTITVTPSGGFTGAVNLSCAVTTSITNPFDAPTCSVPASVTISGTTAATATLTVTTTAATSGALTKPLDRFFLGGGATLAMLFLFGMPGRRKPWRGMFALVAILLVGGAIGCGGKSGTGTTGSKGTTAGAYTVTVTGKDAATGQITSSTPVTLTVN